LGIDGVVVRRIGRVKQRALDFVYVLNRDGRGRVLLSVAGGWLLVLGFRLMIPALLPRIKTVFSISNTLAGIAVTIVWFTYAMMQFPGGLLSNRFGERSLLLSGVLLGTVGVFVISISPVFLLFLLACGLFGLGTGLYGVPRVTLLSKLYPSNDGTAIGLLFAAGNIGATVLPIIAGIVSVRYGWRIGFGFVLPLFLLVTIGLWRSIPQHSSLDETESINHSSDEMDETSTSEAITRLKVAMNDRTIILVCVAITVLLLTYQGLTAFLPTYLVAVKGLSPSTAATLFGVFFATGAVVQPLTGYAADRFGNRSILILMTGFHSLTLILLPFISGLAALTVFVVLLGVRAGLGPVNNAYLIALLPDDVLESGYGLIRTIYLGVGSTGSIIVGLFADAGLFDEAFLFLGGLAGGATVLYTLLPKHSKYS
jgi:predicted MFS family arabinose efflux permease